MRMQNYTWKKTSDQTQISMKIGAKGVLPPNLTIACLQCQVFIVLVIFVYNNHLFGGCIWKGVCYAKGGGMFVGQECNWACVKRWARFLHSLGQASFLVSNEFDLFILEPWFAIVIFSTFHHGLALGHPKWIGCILCMFNW